MTPFDLSAVLLGLAFGAVTSAVFFLGLGLGMRIALRSKISVVLLILSSALRIAMILGIGWLLTQQIGPWALLGYALAFLIVRFVATNLVRMNVLARSTP